MSEQRKIIHDDNNGLDYVLVGDYYMPMLALPEENRPILPEALERLEPWSAHYDVVQGQRYDYESTPFFWQHHFMTSLCIYNPLSRAGFNGADHLDVCASSVAASNDELTIYERDDKLFTFALQQISVDALLFHQLVDGC